MPRVHFSYANKISRELKFQISYLRYLLIFRFTNLQVNLKYELKNNLTHFKVESLVSFNFETKRVVTGNHTYVYIEWEVRIVCV